MRYAGSAGLFRPRLFGAIGAVSIALASGAAVAATPCSLADYARADAVLPAGEEVPIELDINVADLTPTAEAELKELVGDREGDDESVAPHLYLGPRVASIVRDVFGESASAEAGGANPIGVTMPPLAEVKNPEPAATSEKTPKEDAAGDDEIYSPLRLQRQMYRTDI